jgi:hypothetical protein
MGFQNFSHNVQGLSKFESICILFSSDKGSVLISTLTAATMRKNIKWPNKQTCYQALPVVRFAGLEALKLIEVFF